MNVTAKNVIEERISTLRTYYTEGHTKPIDVRIRLLKELKTTILERQNEVSEALHADLKKSQQEGFITEIGLVVKEIDIHLKKLKKWSKPRRVGTPLYLLPSSSKLIYEPRGTVLIVAPWNYPFQLLMTPLIGAISAGNTVLLKPSEFSENTNAVMESIVQQVFDQRHVNMVHGGKETNQILFSEKFDLIYFTGSPYLGRIVMQAAAEHLTPVVLELGGKSPCIIDETADIKIAAKRIAWGKTVNLGQTCIAPDYLLVNKKVSSHLQEAIIENWKSFFGSDPQKSEYLPRMINESAFDRVASYLSQGKVVQGGVTDKEDLYISPTLLSQVDMDASVMSDEIFGPILPIIEYEDIQEAIDLINSKEKPLSYYYFGSTKRASKLLEQNTSGGACINDTLIHISNHKLPFGGVGNSGIGRCHGKYSFESFSNARSVMTSPTWIDLAFRYPPFKNFKFVKRLLS